MVRCDDGRERIGVSGGAAFSGWGNNNIGDASLDSITGGGSEWEFTIEHTVMDGNLRQKDEDGAFAVGSEPRLCSNQVQMM